MRGNVIAFANQKGGVGKTTTAINLAAALAERRQRVLLIDLDPQANATSGLGVSQKQGASLYEVLLGTGKLIEKVQATSMQRLFLIPSEVDLAGAEVDVARSERYLHRFKEALDPLSGTSPLGNCCAHLRVTRDLSTLWSTRLTAVLPFPGATTARSSYGRWTGNTNRRKKDAGLSKKHSSVPCSAALPTSSPARDKRRADNKRRSPPIPGGCAQT